MLILTAGFYYGAKAYSANAAQQEREASCRLVRETESLYADQRKISAGPRPEVAFLGDSYSEGLYIASPFAAFPYLLAKERGMSVAVDGVGGSGYVAGGPCDGQQLSTRLSSILQSKPKVLVVQAGINDRGKPGVGTAARKLFEGVRTISPDTKVIALGPFAPSGAAGPELDAVALEISTAAQSSGVLYIDPRSWQYPLIEDNLHPSASGHRVIADRLSVSLSSAL